MSRRVLGALAAAGVVLFSWGALSQTWSAGAWAALVVESRVLWNTYIGWDGKGDDELRDIVQSPTGDVFIAGKEENDRTFVDEDDIALARFQADGVLVWQKYFGGNGEDDYDRANAITLGSGGEVYIAGETQSNAYSVNLPDGGPGTRLNGSPKDGFIARIDKSTGNPDWFYHLGGTEPDEIFDMASLPDGGLLVVGRTRSNNLPNALGGFVSGWDGFISLLTFPEPNAPPQVAWTHYISGSGATDEARAVAVATGGTSGIYVVGATDSPDLLENFKPRTTDGGLDAFVARFDLDTRRFVALEYLGGGAADRAFGVVVDPLNDQLVVAGSSASISLPGTEGDDTMGSGLFVAKYALDLKLVRTVRIGSTEVADRGALSLGEDKSVYVGGRAIASSAPLTGGFDNAFENNEGYVARVQFESRPWVTWSSFVGGNADDDLVLALHSDRKGRLLIGGTTSSTTGVVQYSSQGHDREKGTKKDMLLLSVEMASPDGGTGGGDGGTGGGDGGTGGGDGGTGGGDGSTGGGNGGTGGGDDGQGTPPEQLSALGWGCAASTGTGALALGTLAGWVLLGALRRKAVPRS